MRSVEQVRAAGRSMIITIPSDLVRAMDLRVGDYVEFDIVSKVRREAEAK